jgi:hypothetical protein
MKKNARQNETVDVDEVPNARNADRMTVAGRADEWREIAGVVFGRPKPVPRNFDRCQAKPFTARRAMVVEVQTRVIHQDG